MFRKSSIYQDATPHQKILYSYGIPKRYWDIKRKDIIPEDIIVPKTRIRQKFEILAPAQLSWLGKLKFHPRMEDNPSGIVGIGSVPTDDLALGAMYYIAQKAIADQARVTIVDLAWYNDEDLGSFDVICMHNLLAESSSDYLQATRAILRKFEGSFRVVAIAGSDPISFFDNHLRHTLDAALYFNGNVVRRKTS